MLSDLAWLPPPPANFRESVKVLRAEAVAPGDNFYERAVALATAALDENQLGKLARLARETVAGGSPPPSFARARLGLIGDGTLSLLAPVIAGSGLRHGLLIDVIEGAYGSAVQQAMDPSGPLHGAGLDMLLVACDVRSLGLNRAADSIVGHNFD